ncbi:MAG: response regulator, partial [Psychroserpens sp.]|nr:response regulator [Psychroserpens sp.]
MNNSNNISCLVVDDELSSQKVLEHFIGQTEILDLKHVCKNTAEAFKYMQTNSSVDVLFLDINMPKQTGLDFYKNLQNPPAVIFTTAYPQYAVEGFEVNATDYLLKPFSYDRFLTAVNKILNTKKDAITQPSDHIILKENKTLYKVMFKNINYVEAFGDYVKV